MTAPDRPETGGDPEQGRIDNGLRAPEYVPLTDVDAAVGQHLLTALGRARIAAYLGPSADAAADQRRLFVASDERVDARTIVAAAVRALGTPQAALPEPAPDPLAGLDTDAAFEALIADWHIDTHTAIKAAERDLNHDDAEWRARLVKPPAQDPIWLDDDHYVPPPPPPLPRLAAPTIIAMTVLAISILLLGLGGQFGLAGQLTFVLGLGGLLLGAGILLSRVRTTRRDEDDDGAAL
jgi:hypothetical protein